MTMKAVSAVWRESARREWKDVEIVGEHASGRLVLREVGKFYAGIWLADRYQVRIAGREFYLREAS